jgi:RNA polymerase sigma factor (sigma-70 family)
MSKLNRLPLQTLKLATEGDEKATQDIIRQYTPLVHRLVNKYKFLASNGCIEDMVQEGLIAIKAALETYNPPGEITWESWMTWAYYKVRHAVQSEARRESKHKFRNEPLELSKLPVPHSCYSNDSVEYNMEPTAPSIKQLIIDGCGSLGSKRATVVCKNFGLMGHKPTKAADIARELGMSKQSVSGYLSRFSKSIRDKHPELKELIEDVSLRVKSKPPQNVK